jgi:hypothetical protein
MHTDPRPYVLGGVALAGASLIAVSPIGPPLPGTHTSDAAVRLAADSVMNIPENLIDGFLNIPYYLFAAPYTLPSYLDYTEAGNTAGPGGTEYPGGGGDLAYLPPVTHGALNEIANVLNYDGNLWQLTSTNVLGIDPGDAPKGLFFDALMPMFGEQTSQDLGQQVLGVLEAEIPVGEGCVSVSVGGCTDLGGFLSTYFTVSTQQLEAGYTYPELYNPVPSGEPIPPGFPPGTPIPIPEGYDGSTDYLVPWAGTTFTENLNLVNNDIMDYLMGTPTGVHTVTPAEIMDTMQHLGQASNEYFNPFVEGTYCLPCAPFVPGGAATSGAPGAASAVAPEMSSIMSALTAGTLPSAIAADLSTLFGPAVATDTSTLLSDLETGALGPAASEFDLLLSELTGGLL